MIQLGILEDNTKIRELLKKLLGSDPMITVVESYGDAEVFLEKANFENLDVVVSDIGLPGMNGVAFVKALKERYPRIKVLMFTVFESNDYLFSALKAGASGYLLKDSSMAELKEGIHTVTQGGAIMGPGIAQKVLAYFSRPMLLNSEEYDLTVREAEISNLIVRGNTNKQISQQLFISEETVKWHIKNIYAKLAVNNRIEFIKRVDGIGPK